MIECKEWECKFRYTGEFKKTQVLLATVAQSFRSLRKFCASRKLSDSDIPRAKSPRFGSFWLLTLCLRVSLREIFRLFWLRRSRARLCCGGGFYFVFSGGFWIPVFTGMTDSDSALCKHPGSRIKKTERGC
jgi:hypothetical protein